MKKELRRSVSDRVIFGVCGGIAEYFNIDSNVVRLVWAGISLFAGAGIVLYILAAFLLPKEDSPEQDLKDVVRPEAAGRKNEAPQERDLKDVIHPDTEEN